MQPMARTDEGAGACESSQNVRSSEIAHDLRNLLASARSNLHALERRPAELNLRLGRLQRLLRRAGEMVESLFSSDEEPSESAHVVQVAEEALDHHLSEAGVRTELELQGNVCYAAIPPLDFYRVLSNLCANSLRAIRSKFGSDSDADLGRVSVRVETQVRSAPDGEGSQADPYVSIRFLDNGCGMSRQTMDKVFRRGYTTQEGKGHGQGMSFVQGVVREHGGWIEVESREGEGTVFTIWLPQADPPAAPAAAPAAQSAPVSAIGQEILIVEDEEDIRDFVSSLVLQSGFLPIAAPDGEKALELIEDRSPALVIMDWKTPGISGKRLHEEFQRRSQGTPIMAMTGDDDAKKICDGFIRKPFEPEDFLSTVVRCLEQR